MIVIDKNKTYESHGYKFKNFINLSEEEKLTILQWRNHEKIRQMMLNKNIITVEEHLGFIDGLANRNDCAYWLVFNPKNEKIGVVDIHHIDRKKNEADLGFYMNPSQELRWFEFFIECNYFMYACLEIETNTITINVNNKYILLVNEFLGATFDDTVKIGEDNYYVGKVSLGDKFRHEYEFLTLSEFIQFLKKRNTIKS